MPTQNPTRSIRETNHTIRTRMRDQDQLTLQIGKENKVRIVPGKQKKQIEPALCTHNNPDILEKENGRAYRGLPSKRSSKKTSAETSEITEIATSAAAQLRRRRPLAIFAREGGDRSSQWRMRRRGHDRVGSYRYLLTCAARLF